MGAEAGYVGSQIVCEREPLASFPQGGELLVALLFDAASAAFEGEQLVMADVGQALPWATTRPDLHAAVVAQVVHDLDDRPREFEVRGVAVPPAAHRAHPGALDADAVWSAAEVARSGKTLVHQLHTMPGLRHRTRAGGGEGVVTAVRSAVTRSPAAPTSGRRLRRPC